MTTRTLKKSRRTGGRQSRRKKILLAFTGLPLAAEILRVASLFAGESEAELEMMRIHPPAGRGGTAVDGEQLYSELRTLYAQLQERGIPARLRVEPGSGDEPIRSYLTRHAVDLLIVCGQKGRDGRLGKEMDELMHTVLEDAPCTAMMVA